MKNEKNGASGGLGFAGLLQVAFIVLKLCKVISWSWLWVLAPSWIMALLVVAIFVLCILLN